MTELKTKINDNDVLAFINAIDDQQRQKDSAQLLKLFSRVTNEPAKMWGASIVGFGLYHYKSERSSQEGDWMLTGFSPRKAGLSLYIFGLADYADLLKQLGKHKIGKGCLYINKLQDVDINILEQLIQKTYLDAKDKYTK